MATKSNECSLFSTLREPSVNRKDLRASNFSGSYWKRPPSCTTPRQPTISFHMYSYVKLIQSSRNFTVLQWGSKFGIKILRVTHFVEKNGVTVGIQIPDKNILDPNLPGI